MYEEALNYKLEWQPLCIYQLPFDFFSLLTKVLLLWKSKLQEIAIWCQIGGKNNKKLVCPMIGVGGTSRARTRFTDYFPIDIKQDNDF